METKNIIINQNTSMCSYCGKTLDNTKINIFCDCNDAQKELEILNELKELQNRENKLKTQFPKINEKIINKNERFLLRFDKKNIWNEYGDDIDDSNYNYGINDVCIIKGNYYYKNGTFSFLNSFCAQDGFSLTNKIYSFPGTPNTYYKFGLFFKETNELIAIINREFKSFFKTDELFELREITEIELKNFNTN